MKINGLISLAALALIISVCSCHSKQKDLPETQVQNAGQISPTITDTIEQNIPEEMGADQIMENKSQVPVATTKSQTAEKKKNVETKKFDMYETETYLIIYGDIQHLDIKDKQGNIVVSEDMQQTVSTKKLNKGETYNIHITAKDSTKTVQSFVKTF